MILIRYLLILIIGYLLIRAFVNYEREEKLSSDLHKPGKKEKTPSKKVSKKIGEYIDYEEIKKPK